MIWSCESRCLADSGSGNMSRRLPISPLIRSRRCFEAPFVDLIGVEADRTPLVTALFTSSLVLLELVVNFSKSKLLRTSICAPSPMIAYFVQVSFLSWLKMFFRYRCVNVAQSKVPSFSHLYKSSCSCSEQFL